MEEMLNRILGELQGLRQDIGNVQTEVGQIRTEIGQVQKELRDFRQSQDLTNKLLAADVTAIKNQFHDFRREFREWQNETDKRVGKVEDRLNDMRNALQ